MKFFLLMFLLLIGIVIVSNAQKIAVSRKSDAGERAKMLQKLLNLNDDQTAKISAIYQEAGAKFDEIKVKEQGNTDKMLVASRPLIKETRAKIKGVLQPRQAVDYDKLIKKYSISDNNGGWATNQGTADYY